MSKVRKRKARLLAKVTPPHLDRPVLRERLFRRLDELRAAPVIWVAGAPGAGKTTLVSSYLHARGLAMLWYQLDADDTDVATFFHYLRLAVENAAGDDQLSLPALQPELLSGLLGLTRQYVEAIGASLALPAAIVLDNYETVDTESPLHDVVRELAAALPHGITLIAMSRGDPPASLARMRLHQQLRTIGADELNLTRDEATSVIASRDAPQADDDDRIDRLLDETQGWFAGFNLLLDEGGDVDFGGSDGQARQLLFEYFTTELFRRFDAAAQAALLRIVLLPSMTVADAQRMSGDPAVGDLLAGLHRKNFFVAKRGQTPVTYEFHAMFRTFLLTRAIESLPDDEWAGLRRKAADLLAEIGQPDAAAHLYRAVEDWQGLAKVALLEAPGLVSTGRHRTLDVWLSALPVDIARQTPWLDYWLAMARLPFDPVGARAVFARAYDGFLGTDDAAGLYAAWAGAMESFFFEWRDFRAADEWIARYESLTDRHPVFPSQAVERRTYWAMGTLLHREPGHPLLSTWSTRGLALLDRSDRDLSVLLGGYLVIWFLWRGETLAASNVVEQITPWVAPDVSPLVRILWLCATALDRSVRGDLEGCLASVQKGLALGAHTGLHAFDFLLAAQMARCSLVAGDLPEADRWITMMGGTMRTRSHIDGAFHAQLQSHLALQRDDVQRALDHARAGLAMAIESGVPFLEANCRICLARALIGRSDGAEWVEHVDSARAIGAAMRSRVVEYLCVEIEATAAFGDGDAALGLSRLATALALSDAMGGATWLMGGPRITAGLYDRALAAGIETTHVRRQVRLSGLMPPDAPLAADAWPWPIRVRTLGQFEIVLDDEPLRSTGKVQRKPLELLKCLCAFGGSAGQDRIGDALWPDTEGDAADQALRTTLHRLRKLLGNDTAIRLEDRRLSIDARVVWVDCLRFDQAAWDPQTTEESRLRRALSHYRGPFLHGESAAWALPCRASLRAHFVRMTERLGDLLSQSRRWNDAAACYLRAIDIEPATESFYRALMDCHARLGNRAEALAVYQRCRHALLSRFGVSPTQETLQLHRQLAED